MARSSSSARPVEPTLRLRELVVPALMLVGIGFFVYDSLHLSVEAMLLPAGLIVVIIASLAWALGSAFLRCNGPTVPETAQGEDDAPGPILNLKAWLLVMFPAVLVMLMDELGAALALVALVFFSQLVFSRPRPLRSLLIAVAVTAPTYAIFKYFLYARFPLGALGIG